MIFTADCMYCLINRQYKDIAHISDVKAKSEFMREVLDVIHNAPTGVSAPVVFAKISRIHEKYFGKVYDFAYEKKKYNDLMLSIEDKLRIRVKEEPDSLLYSLKLSRAGNYIDFGALSEVDDDKLFSLIENCAATPIDEVEYLSFTKSLQASQTLVFLTDNCGEVVCDKILIDTIKELYPHVQISVIVRGEAALNDVTIDDALYVGLDKTAEIYSNGTNIAGTSLNDVPPDIREMIENADMVISKGQANFETLCGCGLNIFYILLCKCDLYAKIFDMQKFEGIFINDKNIIIKEEYAE